MVGLDWGIVRFYTLSDGEYQEQCQPLKKCLPKVGESCSAVWASDRKVFSSNWKKVKAGIAKVCTIALPTSEKIFLHQSLERHQQKKPTRWCLSRTCK